MEALYWLILFVGLVIIEMATMALTTIWFAGGALVAALFAWIGVGLPVQVVVFIASSVILLVLTKPIVKKHLNQRIIKTNTDSMVGIDTPIIEKVEYLKETGKVRINDIEWRVIAENRDDIYEVEDIVTIQGVRGATLIVSKKAMD